MPLGATGLAGTVHPQHTPPPAPRPRTRGQYCPLSNKHSLRPLLGHFPNQCRHPKLCSIRLPRGSRPVLAARVPSLPHPLEPLPCAGNQARRGSAHAQVSLGAWSPARAVAWEGVWVLPSGRRKWSRTGCRTEGDAAEETDATSRRASACGACGGRSA